VLDLFWLLLTTILAWARPRQDLVLENLLLRHQLAVLSRPTRNRPRAERVRAVINAVATAAPDGRRARTSPEWFERYSRRIEDYRLPEARLRDEQMRNWWEPAVSSY
jgi:hypothetical protein